MANGLIFIVALACTLAAVAIIAAVQVGLLLAL
jgi:hypothetical protein